MIQPREEKMIKSKIFILMVGVFLSLGIFSATAMEPMMKPRSVIVGQKAPVFKLPNLNGSYESLDDVRKGKNAILFFWTTWCPHCRTQLKEIQVNKEKYVGKDFELILIDCGESKEQVMQYVNRNGITFNVFLDTDGQISEQYQILGFPTFVFINQQGIITAVEHHLPANFSDYFK